MQILIEATEKHSFLWMVIEGHVHPKMIVLQFLHYPCEILRPIRTSFTQSIGLFPIKNLNIWLDNSIQTTEF